MIMKLHEIRKMFQLMDSFVDEDPLDIVILDTISVANEEISHIKVAHKAMQKERKKFSLNKFEWEQD